MQATFKFMSGMTKRHAMKKSKIAITVSPPVLIRLDAWVQNKHFASRSEAIGQAVEAQLQRLERTRLSEQCALLDVADERTMADMSLAADAATRPLIHSLGGRALRAALTEGENSDASTSFNVDAFLKAKHQKTMGKAVAK